MESTFLPPQLPVTVSGALDGGEIVRHIARDMQVPDIIRSGTSKGLQWPEVYKCIVLALKTDNVKIDIVDTALLQRRDVLHYTYTDVEGNVKLKAKSLHNLRSIHAEFMKIAYAIQGDEPKRIALCYKYDSSTAIVLDTDSFESFCFELVTAPAFSTEIELIQCFVPSKGSDGHYRTYKTTFWLENHSSVPQMKTERLDVTSAVSGSTGIQSKLNMSRQANKMMEATVQQVIRLVEKVKHCRVTRAAFDFVQDHNGKIWLLGSSECNVVTTDDRNKRASSPEKLKMSRTMQLAESQRRSREEQEDAMAQEELQSSTWPRQQSTVTDQQQANAKTTGRRYTLSYYTTLSLSWTYDTIKHTYSCRMTLSLMPYTLCHINLHYDRVAKKSRTTKRACRGRRTQILLISPSSQYSPRSTKRQTWRRSIISRQHYSFAG